MPYQISTYGPMAIALLKLLSFVTKCNDKFNNGFLMNNNCKKNVIKFYIVSNISSNNNVSYTSLNIYIYVK